MKPITFKGLPIQFGDLTQVEISVEAIRYMYTTLLCQGRVDTEFGMFCCGMRAVVKSFFEEVLQDKEFLVYTGRDDLIVFGLTKLFIDWFEETKRKQTMYDLDEKETGRNLQYGATVLERVERVLRRERGEEDKEEE